MSLDHPFAQSRIPLSGACSGVYCLIDGNEVVYVGEGWNCLLRVAEHTRKDSDKIFSSWKFVAVDGKPERKALELELRRKYRPRYNRQ